MKNNIKIKRMFDNEHDQPSDNDGAINNRDQLKREERGDKI